MTLTEQFQRDVANNVTRMLRYSIEAIKGKPEWEAISNAFSINPEFIYDIQDLDVRELFLAEQCVKNELVNISRRLGRLNNPPYLCEILQCFSEPVSRYYEHDADNVPLDYDHGEAIYSPRVDLAIAPSIQIQRNGAKYPISIYPLNNGTTLFTHFSNLSIIRQYNEGLERFARENYSLKGLRFQRQYINQRPLFLFAFEIENQLNKKHLTGDFLNCMMLAKYPTLIVPSSKFDSAMELVKLTDIIYKIKGIDIKGYMDEVAIIKVEQFRELTNNLLNDTINSRLGVEEYQ